MAKKFGFNYPYPAGVKTADTQMLILEKRFVKMDERVWPMYEGIEVDHLRHLVDLKPWQPQRAKREFLERYEELTRDRNEQVRREGTEKGPASEPLSTRLKVA